MIVGISGGTGSGKTTIAHNLIHELEQRCSVICIQQDSYYIDQSYLSLLERNKINYDHPDVIDFQLLIDHIKLLNAGQSVEIPIYNFKTHTREKRSTLVEPGELIIVEGILIFTNKELLDLFDYKIFVDTPDDIRFIRRLSRDLNERGRSVDVIVKQYIHSVRSMHQTFVEPSKRLADIIIPEGGHNKKAIQMIIHSLFYYITVR